jgi:hypothetical protein
VTGHGPADIVKTVTTSAPEKRPKVTTTKMKTGHGRADNVKTVTTSAPEEGDKSAGICSSCT